MSRRVKSPVTKSPVKKTPTKTGSVSPLKKRKEVYKPIAKKNLKREMAFSKSELYALFENVAMRGYQCTLLALKMKGGTALDYRQLTLKKTGEDGQLVETTEDGGVLNQDQLKALAKQNTLILKDISEGYTIKDRLNATLKFGPRKVYTDNPVRVTSTFLEFFNDRKVQFGEGTRKLVEFHDHSVLGNKTVRSLLWMFIGQNDLRKESEKTEKGQTLTYYKADTIMTKYFGSIMKENGINLNKFTVSDVSKIAKGLTIKSDEDLSRYKSEVDSMYSQIKKHHDMLKKQK